jgi:hypothetical protein
VYASACGYSFAYMHCWSIMKGHPKWMELRPTWPTGDSLDEVLGDEVPQDTNTVDQSAESSPPAGSSGKRPMGRDAAKAARKKAASTSSGSYSEFAADMKSLNIEKIGIMEKTLNCKLEMHEQSMQIEHERLELEKRKIANEEERERRKEEERILSIDLDKCTPALHLYYEALQEDILQKITEHRKPGE